ncbi:MAG: hypothetical protein WCK60_00350 [Candidatus Nomurabacteria bacterium]
MKIKIESIVEDLDYGFKRALEESVIEILPSISVDRNILFKAFIRSVGRKFNTWEEVRDDYIQK